MTRSFLSLAFSPYFCHHCCDQMGGICEEFEDKNNQNALYEIPNGQTYL